MSSTRFSNDIKRWVAAGPPFEGAANAFQALQYGYKFGMPEIPLAYKRLSVNMPAIYNLLPTEFLLIKVLVIDI
ncbi:hypothetical protein KHA80_05465 [Anaerobacillus sp. HL2]|nr:hypothetical protein KHA80_05465 [Anaerobacillus sp. HL2]